MHLLTQGSEEGELDGLGWIPANTKRFPPDNGYDVPHMGWNTVEIQTRNALTHPLPEDPRYYFAHSYYVEVGAPEYSMLKTQYPFEFDAGIFNDDIYGVQFHPEKSHKYGLALLENFTEL